MTANHEPLLSTLIPTLYTRKALCEALCAGLEQQIRVSDLHDAVEILTLRMSRDGALQHEVLLEDVLYDYHCQRRYALQWILDRTQTARHATGR